MWIGIPSLNMESGKVKIPGPMFWNKDKTFHRGIFQQAFLHVNTGGEEIPLKHLKPRKPAAPHAVLHAFNEVAI